MMVLLKFIGLFTLCDGCMAVCVCTAGVGLNVCECADSQAYSNNGIEARI